MLLAGWLPDKTPMLKEHLVDDIHLPGHQLDQGTVKLHGSTCFLGVVTVHTDADITVTLGECGFTFGVIQPGFNQSGRIYCYCY
jgi:hypothetical protein